MLKTVVENLVFVAEFLGIVFATFVVAYLFEKIANKTYGICDMCEEEIGIPRLKVKPHAKYCIACREIIEKTAKN